MTATPMTDALRGQEDKERDYAGYPSLQVSVNAKRRAYLLCEQLERELAEAHADKQKAVAEANRKAAERARHYVIRITGSDEYWKGRRDAADAILAPAEPQQAPMKGQS